MNRIALFIGLLPGVVAWPVTLFIGRSADALFWLGYWPVSLVLSNVCAFALPAGNVGTPVRRFPLKLAFALGFIFTNLAVGFGDCALLLPLNRP